jgi:hypothetical protein
MNYCILDEDGIITNMIDCDDPEEAEKIGAVPENPGLWIGDKYVAPPDPLPQPTEMEQLRADVDYLLMMEGD